jgi:hypothetical protein
VHLHYIDGTMDRVIAFGLSRPRKSDVIVEGEKYLK